MRAKPRRLRPGQFSGDAARSSSAARPIPQIASRGDASTRTLRPVPSRKSRSSRCWPNLARLPGDYEVKAPFGPALLVELAHLPAQCLGRARVRGLPDALGRLGVIEQQRLRRHHEVLGRRVGHAVDGEGRPATTGSGSPSPPRRTAAAGAPRTSGNRAARRPARSRAAGRRCGRRRRRRSWRSRIRSRAIGTCIWRAGLAGRAHHEDVNRVLVLDDEAVALVERSGPAALQDVQAEGALTPVIGQLPSKHRLSRLPRPGRRAAR